MRKPRIEWWPIWVGLAGLPIFFLSVYFASEDRGFAALMFMVSIGFAIAAHWNSRRHLMFWLGAVLLIVIHVPLVLLVPWPTWKLSGAAFTPIVFLDFLANFAVMRLIQMAIKRRGREPTTSW